jgi:protein-tyrosine sulfotransferase
MKKYPETLHQLFDIFVSYRNGVRVPRYPLKGVERYRPFFIIGSGRSGSTLLRRMLNNHSMLGIPPETYVLGEVIKRYRQNRSLEWGDLVDLILSTFAFHPEFDTFDMSLQPLVQELQGAPINNRNLAYILDSFFHYSCEKRDKNCVRWGDKTPSNTFMLERIFSVFPDATFIHILRDGCDVVSSYVEAGIYSSYEEAANRWRISVRLVEKFYKRYPNAGITIKYENLVAEPQRTLTKICSFLEVGYEESMLQNSADIDIGKLGDVEKRKHHANVKNALTTTSIGKGRAILSDDQKKKIDNIIGRLLQRLGYEKCTF